MFKISKRSSVLFLIVLLLPAAAWGQEVWVPKVAPGEGGDVVSWVPIQGGEELPLEAPCEGRISPEDVAWNVVVGDFDGDGEKAPAVVVLESCELVAPEDAKPGGVLLPNACAADPLFGGRGGPSCEAPATEVMTQVTEYETGGSRGVGPGNPSGVEFFFCWTTQLECWEVLFFDCTAGGICQWETATVCLYRKCCLTPQLTFSCSEFYLWS